jgi:hypothetical protein
MKILTLYIITSVLLLYACGSKQKNYRVTATERYLEATWPLINGVQIDELEVTEFSKDNTPYEFYLKQAVSLKRKPNTSIQTPIKNVIFFDRPNEHFYWQNDSTWGLDDISITDYKYRGSLSKRDRFDFSYQQRYEVYPFAFKPGTWYLIDFIPTEADEKHHEFMYVDSQKTFSFYRLKEI